MRSVRSEWRTLSCVLGMALAGLAAPEAWADTTMGFAAACNKVDAFFKNFETILKVISVTVVTIAVVFAGYQISFAHRRLSDVAPILLGGLLIGGGRHHRRLVRVGLGRIGVPGHDRPPLADPGGGMKRDVLFRGCTRPPMVLGVPYVAFLLGAGVPLLLAMYVSLNRPGN